MTSIETILYKVGTHYYFYDAENRLVQVDGTLGTCASGSTTGTTACYYYDAEGHRVHRTGIGDNDCLNDGNGGVADFAFDLDGHWTSRTNSTGGGSSDIYVAGRHFGSATDGDVFFDHTDWLGTSRLRNTQSLPTSGYETCTSLPFGDGLSCNSTYASNIHFTGKEHDFESGLDNFLARHLTSNMGHFMSPDPGNAGASPDNPQSWNAYAYVQNNPLSLIDPSGLDACVLLLPQGGTSELDTDSEGCDAVGGIYNPGQAGPGTIHIDAPSPADGSDFVPSSTSWDFGGGGLSLMSGNGLSLFDDFKNLGRALVCTATAPMVQAAQNGGGAVGAGLGGSVGVGLLFGLALQGGVQVVADAQGNVGMSFSFGGNPGFGVLGAGALGGGQVTTSSARTIHDLNGWSLSAGASGALLGVGLGLDAAHSKSADTLTLTVGGGVGGRGAAFAKIGTWVPKASIDCGPW
ncbi:MAG: RHS repeat-associated core domain-containing protein [Candidatus Acidiferrum sp.]